MRSITRIMGIILFGFVAIACLYNPRPAAAQECSLGCVPTYGYDYSRDNVNPGETYFKASLLGGTTQNPTHTNSPDLYGNVYAQPLYVSQVSIGGTTKNALFVATEENYVYALDGDTIGNAALWTANLNFGDSAVPDSVLPGACSNISPEVGITGTPVIDVDNNLLYVVTKRYSSSKNVSQWLNVLNLSDGSAAAPALNIGMALGSGFSALNENQRAGLALVSQGTTPGGPQVYVAWVRTVTAARTPVGSRPSILRPAILKER